MLVQSWIVLRDFLAPTALARMAKLLLYSFLAILLKYLAFPPCTCCDCLHYIVVYVLSFHIGQFYCIFFAILALGHFLILSTLGA